MGDIVLLCCCKVVDVPHMTVKAFLPCLCLFHLLFLFFATSPSTATSTTADAFAFHVPILLRLIMDQYNPQDQEKSIGNKAKR